MSSEKIRNKYPDRIPVIVDKAAGSDVPPLDKKKFLVPADLTVSQFLTVIRKRLQLTPEKSIFIYCNNTLPCSSAMMATIYEQYKDRNDGFLYVTYSSENTFG
eukprot:TRINITY_DN5340_c0_g1_i4.p1 TRINITY_DN5340_c0_g1~~TRINITY_DN5340_c0_g1_i4.p1  ORF type:complete len:103 (-),score=23.29 TRINITY_DN5340_c0_g1_i4:279-587(-)